MRKKKDEMVEIYDKKDLEIEISVAGSEGASTVRVTRPIDRR